MKVFRVFLVLAFIVELVYTITVGGVHGWNFLTVIYDSITSLTWVGQFNLDFSFYLIISAIWVAWRDKFSPISIVLAIMALIGGILFLSVYLFVLSLNTNNSVKELLTGQN